MKKLLAILTIAALALVGAACAEETNVVLNNGEMLEMDQKLEIDLDGDGYIATLYRGTADGDYAAVYRSKSMVIGRPIRVISPAGTRNAYALDVDRDCRLIVRWEDGTVESLSSAEVSIRPEGLS